jgi:hypothetical protein
MVGCMIMTLLDGKFHPAAKLQKMYEAGHGTASGTIMSLATQQLELGSAQSIDIIDAIDFTT